MKKFILLYFCFSFLFLGFIPIPGAGVTPVDNLPCDLIWFTEKVNPGTNAEYSVWETVLPDGSSVEIIDGPNGYKKMTITHTDGTKTEFLYYSPTGGASVINYDKEGGLVSFYTNPTGWNAVLSDALCIPAGTSGGEGKTFTHLYGEALVTGNTGNGKTPFKNLPCKLGWLSKQFKTGTDSQYTIWTTVLSDGSAVEIIEGPDGYKKMTISHTDGTKTEFLYYPPTDGVSVINYDKEGGLVSFNNNPTGWDATLSYVLCIPTGTSGGQDKKFTHLYGEAVITGGTGNGKGENSLPLADCEKSDLVITQLTVPDMGTAGKTLSLSVTVVNAGSVPSGESGFEIHLTQGQAVIRPSVLISSLQPGEEKVFPLPIPISDDKKGLGILTTNLDPDNIEDECNEHNNEESVNIRILPPGVSPYDYKRQTASSPLETASGSSSGRGGGGGCPTCDTP